MHRPRFVVAIATAAVLLSAAACGSSSASPSASATGAPTEAPVGASAQPSESPSGAPVESPSAATTSTAAAKCGGVAIRKDPMSDGKVIVRVKTGAKVHVLATVTGDAYQGGSCGTSGSDWLKVDRVNGKSIKVQYGVPFGYVAAGFFQ